MEHDSLNQIGLTIALALATGMICQAVARHVRLPGIVLLLGAGVLLGPDVADLIHPSSLGEFLQLLVGFAVAIILFEGGLNLNLTRLRHQAATIRRLLTWGALITAVGGTLAARVFMNWEWRLCILFGTLVIVTGPTVITPLLRRIKVTHRVETVLEAEGVLIDAIGAVVAVVALQVAISPSSSNFAIGVLDLLMRLGFGFVFGLVAGFVLAMLLRVKRVVPEGLENVLTLSIVLAMFQLSNAALPESGITTVTAAGMVVGNMRTSVRRELMEFKEQLTVMMIGMLFVILAADVRLEEVKSLGWPGVLTVAALMLVVRPVNIVACTIGSDLKPKEKVFLSWLSPRGVVAAAVASLFAQEITKFGIAGGQKLRALVFMVIAITVLVQGLTGGLVARWLGLRRAVGRGYSILGANELGHQIGRVLREYGEDVAFIDSSPSACKVVTDDGFKVIYGNAMESRTLQRARLEDQAAVIAATTSEAVNLLFAKKATEEFKVHKVFLAVRRQQSQVDTDVVHDAESVVLFGKPRDLELWAVRLRKKIATVEPWQLADKAGEGPVAELKTPDTSVLPMVLRSGSKVSPISSGQKIRKGDTVHFALYEDLRDEAEAWFTANGWVRPEPSEPEEQTTSG